MSKPMPMPTTIALQELVGQEPVEPAGLLYHKLRGNK